MIRCSLQFLLLPFFVATVFFGVNGLPSAFAQEVASNSDKECFRLTRPAYLYSTAGADRWLLEVPVAIIDSNVVRDPKHINVPIPAQLTGYAEVVDRRHNPDIDTSVVFVIGLYRLLDKPQYARLHFYIEHADCEPLEVKELSIIQEQVSPSEALTSNISRYARVYVGFIFLVLVIAIGLMISLLSYRFDWFGQRTKLDKVLSFPWTSDG